ncbi:hypothetical protein ABEB36_002677 [Hypothenemus hampei]|uniref:Uncharacterized protein n=1 Tax=Hypothenemus hampei TaxID=57062 RepID=A0ABD1F8E3_HYPHA
MAVRTLQLCLVFAVGLNFFDQVAGSSNRGLPIDSPSSPLSGTLSQLWSNRHNVSLRLVEEPDDVIVARGQNATLHCQAKSSTGNVTITWLYENVPISEDDPRWSIRWSELRVVRVSGGKKTASRGNIGQYACLVGNDFGNLLSRTAKVKVASIDKEVLLTGNTTIYESQPLLLQCSVHSIPPADIQWEFNHLPLPNDKRYVPLPCGVLLIKNTVVNDSGNYRCIANNNVLKKSKTSKDLEVRITSLSTSTAHMAPSIILVDNFINKTALIGETVEFLCLTTGWPTPKVQWINNKNVTLNDSSTLIIKNVRSKDSGNYTCTATNSLDRKVQIFQLNVYQKPYFNVTPISMVSPSAKTVRIDCQAKGVPPPKLLWLKNGKPLEFEIRIKTPWTGLVFSHTVSTDAGIYQCLAINSVGQSWTAAQIEINNSESPSPPQNVHCRPFDDTKICLTWKNPPNVTSVQAYSIYSSYKENETEIPGTEYVVQDTFQLATNLKHNTNYTFYVRLYSNHASDHSEKVTCQTGLKGLRNLEIDMLSGTTVMVKWDELSSDTSCNGTKDPYVVQWYRDGDESHLSSGITYEKQFIVSGLLPATDYQFRVVTENNAQDELWTMYALQDYQDLENDTSELSNGIRAPKYLYEDATTSTTSRLSWDRVGNAKFYTVCYVIVNENKDCTEGITLKSYSPKLSVSNLKPDTEYLFMVRAHDSSNNTSVLSKPLKIRTLGDVPSPVVDLQYHSLNKSAVCIFWRPPENSNGKLRNYLVSYTTDKNWSLEKRIEYKVDINEPKSRASKCNSTDMVSTFLTNLSMELTYLVMVLAVNDVGIGQPCPPIIVKTFEIPYESDEMLNSAEDVAHNQKLGIILGVILSAFCIVCCTTFILIRRRCLKRRAATTAQFHVSADYHPAVAHYTSELGTVHVRMEEPCSMEDHEIEHLVSEEPISQVPSVVPEHLDTKGASNFPNGCANGVNKRLLINGNARIGTVHITENPQYYAFEFNGNLAKNKSEPLLKHYEEDTNSNVNPLKFYDFYKIFGDTSKKRINTSKSIDSCKESPLNSTQITFLEDSVTSQRRLSPVLEPNG